MGEVVCRPSLLPSPSDEMMMWRKINWTLPERFAASAKNLLRRDQLGPVGLISYFDLQTIAFLGAFLIVVSRRPDAILNAQFYAEDGAAWYFEAYTYGLHSFLMPQAGYLHTLTRIVTFIALQFPFVLAPLVMNFCAIFLQILPVNLFLSSRFSGIPLTTRLLGSLLYLAIPNAAEIHANITNDQWHLALLACMVLLAQPASNWGWRIFDGTVLVLITVTSPLGILLVPVAAVLWWKRRQKSAAFSLALLLPGALVVGLIALMSHQRQAAPNGPTFSRFAAILGRQIILSSLLGRNTQDWLMHLRYAHLLEGIATVVGLSVLVYALRYAQMELKLFVLFAYAVLALALLHPLAGAPDQPQWELLCLPGCGNRYYFLPMLGFLVSLVWIAGRKASSLALRCIAAALLLMLPIGIYRDWKYPPFIDLHFSKYAAQFEQAPAGTHVVIPINPNWNMGLTKH